MKVTCTWGEGPDVLITFDSITNVLNPTTYVDLTSEEAHKLSEMLQSAALRADQLKEWCEEYHKREVIDDMA